MLNFLNLIIYKWINSPQIVYILLDRFRKCTDNLICMANPKCTDNPATLPHPHHPCMVEVTELLKVPLSFISTTMTMTEPPANFAELKPLT